MSTRPSQVSFTCPCGQLNKRAAETTSHNDVIIASKKDAKSSSASKKSQMNLSLSADDFACLVTFAKRNRGFLLGIGLKSQKTASVRFYVANAERKIGSCGS